MRVRFGGFVLDFEARELKRGEEAVPLSPKAFDLLSLLVAQRPKAMAKSDLLDRLWPATFVVEKNLANLVGEIREALGDDPSSPRFIRTVHRFGYAFRDAQAGDDGRSTPSGGLISYTVKWDGGRATLDEGTHVVGRDPDVEIFVNSTDASRRHAVITISSGRATIEDLGSKNGTFVGERRVSGATALGDGDVIRVGSGTLTVKVRGAPRTTETQAGGRRK
jgi:DNA-binding winged helix-turn-helix (wHTH) protein